MEVISIERSTYEELLTSFNSFVTQMKAMAGRGTDKRLGEWLDNQDVCKILHISIALPVESFAGSTPNSHEGSDPLCGLAAPIS